MVTFVIVLFIAFMAMAIAGGNERKRE